MISGVSELCKLTPRAIRFYEEAGLIETTRDELNQRRFDARALDRLHLIARFRRAGLGLSTIRAVLALEDEGCTAQVQLAMVKLLERRANLEQLLCEVEAALRDLDVRPLRQPLSVALFGRTGHGLSTSAGNK
jgi:MerR family transcriptional regulator, redox-sensitive transcriptional activator SoxR